MVFTKISIILGAIKEIIGAARDFYAFIKEQRKDAYIEDLRQAVREYKEAPDDEKRKEALDRLGNTLMR